MANKAKAACVASKPLGSKEESPALASEVFEAVLRHLTCPIWPHPPSPSLRIPNFIQLASLGPVLIISAPPNGIRFQFRCVKFHFSPSVSMPELWKEKENFWWCNVYMGRYGLRQLLSPHLWETGGSYSEIFFDVPRQTQLSAFRFSGGLRDPLQSFDSGFRGDQRSSCTKTLGIWSRIYSFNF